MRKLEQNNEDDDEEDDEEKAVLCLAAYHRILAGAVLTTPRHEGRGFPYSRTETG